MRWVESQAPELQFARKYDTIHFLKVTDGVLPVLLYLLEQASYQHIYLLMGFLATVGCGSLAMWYHWPDSFLMIMEIHLDIALIFIWATLIFSELSQEPLVHVLAVVNVEMLILPDAWFFLLFSNWEDLDIVGTSWLVNWWHVRW